MTRRDKIFQTLKMAFISIKKRNLPVYGIKSKNLRDYQTTEKDLYKQIDRMPMLIARVYEDDIFDEEDDDYQS